jgi:hypothetical protein
MCWGRYGVGKVLENGSFEKDKIVYNRDYRKSFDTVEYSIVKVF